jgi:hypothetical protein
MLLTRLLKFDAFPNDYAEGGVVVDETSMVAAPDDPFCNWIALIKPPFLVAHHAEGPAYGWG